ncbi:MAG: Holliday junction resolvase RuvX [Deltaproteobacteria bacterium]|nr:Holliday junction resolvase RuvX [Deltaproteobacteria bacterium]
MPPRPRSMAIDPGERRWGVAVSDEDDEMALPRPVLTPASEAEGLATIASIVREESVAVIVLGLPLELSGREGPAAKKARALGARMASVLGRPVAMWDERLTSVAASRAMSAGGLSQKKQRGKVDSIAAAILLGAYLEASAAVRERAIAYRPEASP